MRELPNSLNSPAAKIAKMNYKRSDDIKTTLMPDGHVVLFNTKTEWAQVLNPVGSLVWEFCDGKTSCAQLSREIAELLEIEDLAGLEKDINSLIHQFVDLGLVQEIAPSRQP